MGYGVYEQAAQGRISKAYGLRNRILAWSFAPELPKAQGAIVHQMEEPEDPSNTGAVMIGAGFRWYNMPVLVPRKTRE